MEKKMSKYSALKVVQKFFPHVSKVNDAAKDEVVSVLASDVKKSVRKDHNRCAMAEALKRQDNAKAVIVSASLAYVIKHNTATRYKLPEAIRKEIVSFDRNGVFEPGDYLMKKPPKSARLGYQSGGHRPHKNRGSGGPKRIIIHSAGLRKSIQGGR